MTTIPISREVLEKVKAHLEKIKLHVEPLIKQGEDYIWRPCERSYNLAEASLTLLTAAMQEPDDGRPTEAELWQAIGIYQKRCGQTLDDTLAGKWTNSPPTPEKAKSAMRSKEEWDDLCSQAYLWVDNKNLSITDFVKLVQADAIAAQPVKAGSGEWIKETERGLKFIMDIAEEELPHAKVGTGAEVALRHIHRRALDRLNALAATPPEPRNGWVMVPKSAMDWLMGSGPDANGVWFSDGVQGTGKFWWRSEFRKRIDALPAPPPGEGG